jgi:uncharacterized membrane protein YtjA (UPF0391 family)
MLHYAFIFLVLALLAGLLGFSSVAAGAMGIAKMLAVVFIVLAVVSLVVGLLRGR